MAEIDDDLLIVQEVSVFLRKSPSTICRLAREGRLPGKKVGGTWRFSRKALETWLLMQDAQINAATKLVSASLQ